MKGIVCTEFMDRVEEKFSAQMLDQIIGAAKLPNDGAFTALGTYPHHEMVRLVLALHERSGVPVADLLKVFGRYLVGRFAAICPPFFDGAPSLFEFLARIDQHIDVEVRKLYLDAELPRFEHERPHDATFHLLYRSQRGMADLAEGLIETRVDQLGEPMRIEREDLPAGKASLVPFTLRRSSRIGGNSSLSR